MRRTLVIGGGAAGLVAAIAAAECGDKVTVLERNPLPLKKLRATGNGRGNLLNSGMLAYYGNADFARAVLQVMPAQQLISFFEDLGVPLIEEGEGRIYPAAMQASIVVDALRLRAEVVEVRVCCHNLVEGLMGSGNGFIAQAIETAVEADRKSSSSNNSMYKIQTTEAIKREYGADRVIVTVGGSASPAHGTEGASYGLLTGFGHQRTELKPALCALLTAKKVTHGLAGQRVRAALALTSVEGSLLHKTEGEVLFAADGVSGIAAMQLARFVDNQCMLHIDFRPAIGKSGMDVNTLAGWLEGIADRRASRPVMDLFVGFMAPTLSHVIFKTVEITALERPIETLNSRHFHALAKTLADFRIVITGTRGFKAAQVTAGGIRAEEFDPTTLESRLRKGLYAAGEVLDVDGDCGGYNLMFAFASGILAGRAVELVPTLAG